MLSLKSPFSVVLVALLAATSYPSVAQTTAPVRINYDLIGPNDDATSRSYGDVTAVSKHPSRNARLLKAAIAGNFREETTSTFVFYKGLVDGDETDDPKAGHKYVSTIETFGDNVGRQPVGPLTGRIVYCSAGHGWTSDNTSTSLWYTQRPVTHGVVEDMGNLDQMNLYADICFRAGATIVPLRPLGFQHTERVIDNESGHVQWHGQWADSKSTESFGFPGAKIPYKFARAGVEETAVARFKPVIPATDTYPVYAWARAGADRVIQTYRIVHAGGVNEIDIDHRKVGNGWIYLGSYVFHSGNDGYVEITNKVRDARLAATNGVVIADAIRFGNGMGDVNRGGGVSGFPREEEASKYWIQRSLSSGFAPIYEGFPDLGDQSNNVGAAPRYAAVMNQESEGGYFDRVFLSFHSNASGGRGVVGLYNTHAALRPDHQIELAKLTADELNREMTSAGLIFETPWHVNRRLTDAHINFGEIRKDYLNNEMSATIVEVAYHDNADDAALLRKLSVRQAFAQSAYRATLRYFSEVGDAKIDHYAPPNAPTLISVMPEIKNKESVEITWSAADQDPLSSQSDVLTYRLYRSGDGVAFDQGVSVGKATHYSIAKVKPRIPTYFRVTAVTPGGESMPSDVMGASVSSHGNVLIVQGDATVSDDEVLTQTETADLGSATGPGGSFVRIIPSVMNKGEQVRAIGGGVKMLKLGFSSVVITHLSDHTDLSGYDAVCFMMGRSAIPNALSSTATLSRLRDYVTSGGRLLISGASIAECSDHTTETLARWDAFTKSVLQISFGPQTSLNELIKIGDRELTTVTLQLGDRSLRYFETRPTEVLKSEKSGRPVLAYKDFEGAAAVATLKDGSIRTAVLGFPLEEIESRSNQAVLAAQILKGMGMESKAVYKKENAEILIEDARTSAGGKMSTTATLSKTSATIKVSTSAKSAKK